jgi:hypothetical protein
MRLLLDTHALLWWLTNSPRLPARCAARIEDRANDVAISPVSAYEMRFKANKGLLPVSDALLADVPRIAAQEGFTLLPLTWQHALAAGALPLPHRDPFDRLLAAQALTEGYALLSVDPALDGLGVTRVW